MSIVFSWNLANFSETACSFSVSYHQNYPHVTWCWGMEENLLKKLHLTAQHLRVTDIALCSCILFDSFYYIVVTLHAIFLKVFFRRHVTLLCATIYSKGWGSLYYTTLAQKLDYGLRICGLNTENYPVLKAVRGTLPMQLDKKVESTSLAKAKLL